MRKVLKLALGLLWRLCNLLPIQRRKVVLQAFGGGSFADNPKYIALALQQADPRLKLYWAANDPENAGVPQGIRTVRYKSVAYVYHMATAKVWVDNIRKPYSYKRRDQLYIQTWHGCFGLKKIEQDAADRLDPVYLNYAPRDAAMIDLMVSNCRTLTQLYRDAFWYPKGQILEQGLPRNDLLLHPDRVDIAAIRRSLGIPQGVKVALYAPTFRKTQSLAAYDMDYHRCAQALSQRFGGKWVILLRLHPNIFKLSHGISFDNETVFNGSGHGDIQQLYVISDLAITDYSSVMFDFMQTGRPCLMYASDIEAYRQDRDFFISLETLPFPLAQTNDEFEQLILNFDPADYREKVGQFMELHGFCDTGRASDAAAEWILQNIKER